jgi:drug/metabolite transporter (DMT)-like permease
MIARRQTRSIASGLLAIALWSASFALSRSLAEKLGVLATAAAVCLVAGAVGSMVALIAGWHRPALAGLSRRRIAALGTLFVAYQAAMYGALGWARDREAFLVVTVVNYLWPGLTILLAVPLLGRRFRPALVPGILMALAGVALAASSGGVSAFALRAGLAANAVPYGLALVAAVSWALYSNLVARWASAAGSGLVPFYFLAAGVALCPFAALGPETAAWSAGAAGELAFLAIAVMLVGYVAWDFSMRTRESELVPALAYLIPLPSIAVSALYLRIPIGAGLAAGAALVVAGSAVCALTGRESATPSAPAAATGGPSRSAPPP